MARRIPNSGPSTLEAGAHGRFEGPAARRDAAAGPRWLKLGIAAALGVLAGTILFPTRAQGRQAGREAGRRIGRRREPTHAAS